MAFSNNSGYRLSLKTEYRYLICKRARNVSLILRARGGLSGISSIINELVEIFKGNNIKTSEKSIIVSTVNFVRLNADRAVKAAFSKIISGIKLFFGFYPRIWKEKQRFYPTSSYDSTNTSNYPIGRLFYDGIHRQRFRIPRRSRLFLLIIIKMDDLNR